MFQNMKRIVSLVLAFAMVFAVSAMFASCDENTETTTGSDGTTDTTDTTNGQNPPVNVLVRDPNAEYTLNSYTSVFPTVWNIFDYETSTDAIILDYISPGFYTFDYNETLDGYKYADDMAIGDPVDVTADYVGEKWGIAEGDTARAWKVTIRDDIKWQDGTAITAQDFVTSLELLLNPEAGNHRADSVYQGSFQVHNAKNYFYQGQEIWEDNGATEAYSLADLVKGEDGVYTLPNGEAIYFTVTNKLDWCNGNSLQAYVNAYGETYFNMANWETLLALSDENGQIKVTDESIELLASVISTEAWGEDRENVVCYMYYHSVYAPVSMDEVGLIALSDTELVWIIDKPLEGFYLKYNMPAFLVNADLYNSCTTVVDGVFNNTYGTSAATTMSFGPYMLESFQNDKQFVLVKNPNWYGYNDEENKDLYWTTKIVYDFVEKSETAMELFLQGKLDSKSLTADEMDDYSKSEYTYYTLLPSTFFIALNPDFDALSATQATKANTNKTILTLKEFRMALSFALDRAAFCLAVSPVNSGAFGVFSGLIISDPDNGTAYRTTEQAKQVMVDFWGLSDEIGEDKMYETIDDAIDSITGYNLEMGKEYFNKAYDLAIEQGLMDEDDVVEICIGLPTATSTAYNNGYDFLVNNYTEAVKGTKLEGKLTFTRDDTLGNGFGDALRANQVDMLFFVGWEGAALDPYGLVEAYTSSQYQYDPAWDTESATLTINIDGVDYTATVWEWTKALGGTEISIKAADGTTKAFSAGSSDGIPETRLDILAALEGAILQTYDLIPLADDASAALKGMQIKYYTEDYIYGVGRGGVKYMQYYFTDAEWDAYVAEQGGTLNYK